MKLAFQAKKNAAIACMIFLIAISATTSCFAQTTVFSPEIIRLSERYKSQFQIEDWQGGKETLLVLVKALEGFETTDHKLAYGVACGQLGSALARLSHHREAIAWYEAAVAAMTPILGNAHPSVRMIQIAIAGTYIHHLGVDERGEAAIVRIFKDELALAIHFKSGGTHIADGVSISTLEVIGKALNLQPINSLRFRIEGHTDSDGDAAHNLELSQQRADAVAAFLISNFGIAPNRLVTLGRGEDFPLAPNHSEEGKQLNRRVVFVPLGSINNSPSEEKVNSPKLAGTGTGLQLSNGYVLTCAHVLKSAKQVKIVNGREKKWAVVVAADEANDLAVLRVTSPYPEGFPVWKGEPVKVGGRIFTIGFPNVFVQGAEPKFTAGDISSLSGIRGDPRNIQISVPVQPGNSGGPLFTEDGQLIGIVLSKLKGEAVGYQPENVNFAIKASYSYPLLETLEGFSFEENPTKSWDRPELIEYLKKFIVLIGNFQ